MACAKFFIRQAAQEWKGWQPAWGQDERWRQEESGAIQQDNPGIEKKRDQRGSWRGRYCPYTWHFAERRSVEYETNLTYVASPFRSQIQPSKRATEDSHLSNRLGSSSSIFSLTSTSDEHFLKESSSLKD